MSKRRWNRIGHELHGRGNGFHAIVYVYDGRDCIATIRKGDSWIASKLHKSEDSAKRWANKFIREAT